MAGWIPMHIHKTIGGLSRTHLQGLGAPLASYRFLAKAIYHKDTHLKGAQPTHLFNDNVVWQASSPRLNVAQSKEVDRACMFVREIGEQIIVPLLRSIEAEEQGRGLVSFERRFKDTNRLKHKVADRLRSAPGRTPTEALAAIADTVRFTLQYQERGYVTGIRKDVERLRDRGFVLVSLRNTWTGDQYKGINTRWREPTSGLLFEVQFHTQASCSARELTHKAYERIRSYTIEGVEMGILRAFQRHVNAMVPIPPGALDIGKCQW